MFKSLQKLTGNPTSNNLALLYRGNVSAWRNCGHRYMSALWKLQQEKHLVLYDLTNGEIDRMAELMAKYQDTPMDMADASLVAVAESHTFKRVFTLDSDFSVYRLADGSALEPVP